MNSILNNSWSTCCSHGISYWCDCVQCGRYINSLPSWLHYPNWNYNYWPTVVTIYKCPVCEGRGNVPKGFYERREVEEKGTEKCRRCCGIGTIS